MTNGKEEAHSNGDHAKGEPPIDIPEASPAHNIGGSLTRLTRGLSSARDTFVATTANLRDRVRTRKIGRGKLSPSNDHQPRGAMPDYHDRQTNRKRAKVGAALVVGIAIPVLYVFNPFDETPENSTIPSTSQPVPLTGGLVAFDVQEGFFAAHNPVQCEINNLGTEPQRLLGGVAINHDMFTGNITMGGMHGHLEGKLALGGVMPLEDRHDKLTGYSVVFKHQPGKKPPVDVFLQKNNQ